MNDDNDAAQQPAPRMRKGLVRAGTTVDQMVRAIADDIVHGALLPGDKLDEHMLAARFEVSRTPVREALGQLAAMGLAERRPNRGSIVAVVTQDYLASMFESMAELEAICARFCAERMTAEERRALEVEHHASARMVRMGLEEEYGAYDAAFHGRLHRGAHSDHIRDLASLTRNRLAPFRRARFRLPGRLGASWEEHDRIVTAILRGEAAAAASAARAHACVSSSRGPVVDARGPADRPQAFDSTKS